MRALLGFGDPGKRGLSAAANAGFDLCPANPAPSATTSGTTAQPFRQIARCCSTRHCRRRTTGTAAGFSLEYRKYELGAVRNEGVYRFNFTLANIGTAGNLKRAERLFSRPLPASLP